MAELNNIAISTDAENVVDRLMESDLFKNKFDVLTFAAAYMIRVHFKDFQPNDYILTNAKGLNYSFGTLDPDGKWALLIKVLYPQTETPYQYLRALMDAGLISIGIEMNNNANFNITDLI